MAKKRFKSDLSISGIKQLQKDIIKYQNALPNKARLLAERLAEMGVEVINVKIEESPLGKYVSVRTDISADKMGCKAILIATGQVKQSEEYEPFSTLLAIEFGAGIYHNPIANPNAEDFGLCVGTFPGQIHAFEDGWYFWDEEKQQWMYTHGVKATMPMYQASLEIQKNVVKIAKQIFGS